MVALLKDRAQSWYMSADGTYDRDSHAEDADAFSAHTYFMTNPSLVRPRPGAQDASRAIATSARLILSGRHRSQADAAFAAPARRASAQGAGRHCRYRLQFRAPGDLREPVAHRRHRCRTKKRSAASAATWSRPAGCMPKACADGAGGAGALPHDRRRPEASSRARRWRRRRRATPSNGAEFVRRAEARLGLARSACWRARTRRASPPKAWWPAFPTPTAWSPIWAAAAWTW